MKIEDSSITSLTHVDTLYLDYIKLFLIETGFLEVLKYLGDN